MGTGDVFRRYVEGAAGFATRVEGALRDAVGSERAKESSVQEKVENLLKDSKKEGEHLAQLLGSELNRQVKAFGFGSAEELGDVLQRLGALAMSVGSAMAESAEKAEARSKASNGTDSPPAPKAPASRAKPAGRTAGAAKKAPAPRTSKARSSSSEAGPSGAASRTAATRSSGRSAPASKDAPAKRPSPRRAQPSDAAQETPGGES